MTKQWIIAGCAALALATTAQAADLPAHAYNKAPMAVAPQVFSWTGFYLGAHGGYGWADTDLDVLKMKGGFGGGQVGYNFQTGMFVLGVEADASGGSIKDSVSAFGFTGTSEANAFGTVRARAGIAVERALFYGTGGFAWLHNELSVSGPGGSISADQTHTGWTIGGGVEYAFARNWTAKAEYLYSDFGSKDYNFQGFLVPSGDAQLSTFKVGVNYLFH